MAESKKGSNTRARAKQSKPAALAGQMILSVAEVAQHNDEIHAEGDQARGYWSVVAHEVGDVDWKYWASLPHLTPREIACLLVEFDPNKHDFIQSSNTLKFAGLAEYIVNIERVATRKQEVGLLPKTPTPIQWIEWAKEKYGVPRKFKKAVAEAERRAQEEIERKANEEAEQAAQEEAQQNDCFVKYGAEPSAEIYPVWQKRLTEISKDMKSENKLNLYPTKNKACKKLAFRVKLLLIWNNNTS